jgi:hypothetical protein
MLFGDIDFVASMHKLLLWAMEGQITRRWDVLQLCPSICKVVKGVKRVFGLIYCEIKDVSYEFLPCPWQVYSFTAFLEETFLVRGSENKTKGSWKRRTGGYGFQLYISKKAVKVYMLMIRGYKTHPFLRRKPGIKYHEVNHKYHESKSYSFF